MSAIYRNQWAESSNSYYFRVELPNFPTDNIKVQLYQGTLIIKASMEESEDEDEDKDGITNVNVKGTFIYKVDLPHDKIALDKVHAFMDKHFLVIKCPKLRKSDLLTKDIGLLKSNL